jgi:hypothetical protein
MPKMSRYAKRRAEQRKRNLRTYETAPGVWLTTETVDACTEVSRAATPAEIKAEVKRREHAARLSA